MKTEMTQRDKKLLVFLALFVIIVGIGYWGIYPLVRDIFDLKDQIAAAEEQKQINEVKIAKLPMLEAENVKVEEEIAVAKAGYYPMMTSDEIDKLFTGMALDYDLYAYDMEIHMNEEETLLEPYQYSEKMLQGEQQEQQGEYTGGPNGTSAANAFEEEDAYEESDGEEIKPSTGIHTVQISMRLGSDNDTNLKRFINDLSADKARHLIQEYTWEDNNQSILSLKNGSYNLDTVYEVILNITIDIYMCQE